MPSILNRLPIFTNIGFAKVQDAILNGTKVTLSQIALGDAINDIDYALNPAMTALNHELMRINVRSKIIDDTSFFDTLVLRVFGTLVAKDAIDMVIREIGIYDTDGDLIIITRTNNVTTMSPEALRTGVELDIGKKIDANAKDVFEVDYANNTDGVLRYELTAHIEQFVDPHKTTKFQIGLGNVEDVADEDMALSNNLLELIMDSEIATGFVDIDNSILSVAGTVLTLNNTLVSDVYKRGVLFSLPVGAIDIDLAGNYGEYYIGLNPVLNTLYRIDVLDIVNDIPVAFVSVNSIDGIVIYTDERHSASKNNRWYQLEEKTNSISMVSGGKLTGLVGNENASISISAPIRVFNKDLDFTVTDTAIVGNYNQVLTNAKIPVMYIGAGNIIRESKTNLAAGPWLYNANGLLVNDTATGLLNELGDNKYINYYLVITADVRAPIKLVIGHKEHTTLDAAMSEDKDENVILGRINILEAYRITLRKDSTVVNVFKAKIESIVLLLEKTGLRNTFSALSHNDLGSSRFEPDQHGIDNFLGLRELLDAASSQAETQDGILSIDFNGNLQSDLSVFTGTGATIETRQADRRNVPTIYGGAGGEELLQGEYIGNDLGATLAKYLFGTKASNGKIYAPPCAANQILCIDPTDDTASYISTDYGATNSKWIGFTQAPNGMLYAPPSSVNQTLKFDPNTNISTLVGTGYGATGTKWGQGALADNGKIYCPPCRETAQVLVIDPSNDTTSLIGSSYSTTTTKWYSAIKAPNGKIYAAPAAANQILKIDPDTNTTVLIGTDYGTASGKWIGGVLHPNGKIYFPPAAAAQVLVLDPATDTTTLIGPSFSTSVTKWDSACIGTDGRIYCVPVATNQVLIIDPITNTVKLALKDYGSTDTKWIGIYSADNGKMYALPYNSNYVLKLNFIDKTKNYSPIVSKAIGTDLGTTFVSKFTSIALAKNGKLYAPPYRDKQVLMIDPVLQTSAYIGTDYSSLNVNKYGDICLADNGNLYCSPIYVGQVLMVNPVTNTTSYIGTDYGTTIANKWIGIVKAPNGMLYCAPGGHGQVLKINPNTNTTSLIGTNYGTTASVKWYKGCLAVNGKLYFTPYGDATKILCIDPTTDTTSLIGDDLLATFGASYLCCIAAPNGKLYCAPYGLSYLSGNRMLEIDPVAGTTKQVGPIIQNMTSIITAVIGANGKLYAIGASRKMLEFDTDTYDLRIITNASAGGSETSQAMALAPNGKIYCAPLSSTKVLEIDVVDKSTDYGAYLKMGVDSTKIAP